MPLDMSYVSTFISKQTYHEDGNSSVLVNLTMSPGYWERGLVIKLRPSVKGFALYLF